MEENTKRYQGAVWPVEDRPGQRISLMVVDAADAGSQMAQMYGPGAVRTIHNEEDAGRPR